MIYIIESEADSVEWFERYADRANVYYCQHMKSFIGFQLVCLHSTLAHSKGPIQGYANFD